MLPDGAPSGVISRLFLQRFCWEPEIAVTQDNRVLASVVANLMSSLVQLNCPSSLRHKQLQLAADQRGCNYSINYLADQFDLVPDTVSVRDDSTNLPAYKQTVEDQTCVVLLPSNKYRVVGEPRVLDEKTPNLGTKSAVPRPTHTARSATRNAKRHASPDSDRERLSPPEALPKRQAPRRDGSTVHDAPEETTKQPEIFSPEPARDWTPSPVRNTRPPPVDGKDTYYTRILAWRRGRGVGTGPQFLLKWEGYPYIECNWEPLYVRFPFHGYLTAFRANVDKELARKFIAQNPPSTWSESRWYDWMLEQDKICMLRVSYTKI